MIPVVRIKKAKKITAPNAIEFQVLGLNLIVSNRPRKIKNKKGISERIWSRNLISVGLNANRETRSRLSVRVRRSFVRRYKQIKNPAKKKSPGSFKVNA